MVRGRSSNPGHRGWGLLAAAAVMFGIASADEKGVSSLSVLGAANGQLKLSAETSDVQMALTLENAAAKPIAAQIRIAPFREASGELHPAHLMIGPNDKAASVTEANGSAIGEVQLPAMGAVTFRVGGALDAQGEYSSDIVIVHDTFRDVVHLTVTRALRDLGVEILSLDPARSIARPLGASTAKLRVVISEKTGRPVTLDPPILTTFARKQPEGTRIQSPYSMRVSFDSPAATQADHGIPLTPNETLPLDVELSGLEGSGEYQGTLRLVTQGAKPVDQNFTVTLRESPWVAFWFIFAGVVISATLRTLSQSLRPRLLQVQRAQLLIRDLDILLGEPGHDAEELEVLRALRRQAAAILVQLEARSTQGIGVQLEGLERRSRLARNWIPWRRRVDQLTPPQVKEPFREVIEKVRDVIVWEEASAEDITKADADLAKLGAEIEKALRDALEARIKSLRAALAATAGDAGAVQESQIRAEIEASLSDAEAKMATALPAALGAYSVARSKWVLLQIDRLSRHLTDAPPPGFDAAAWHTAVRSLRMQISQARRKVRDDPERAFQDYQAAVAGYIAALCEGLDRLLPQWRNLAASLDPGDDKNRATELLDTVEKKAAAARAALAAGDEQASISAIQEALAAQSAVKPLLPGTRSRLTDAVAGWVLGVTSATLPGPIAAGSTPVTVRERDIRMTSSVISGIDWLSLLVAIVVATLLGITTLWTPKATWGGWEDHIVSLLWGLGLHQFTFAGLSALNDRLTGTRSTEPAS
jgi:hypothetical protein